MLVPDQSQMRFPFLVAALAILLVGSSPPASHASSFAFHLIQIEQVIGGVDGDSLAQAVQVRMRFAGQNVMSSAKIMAYDSTGANPVVLRDMDSTVTNSIAGSRVLLCTASFSANTSPPAVPDFDMSPIPSSYLSSGSLTFENNAGTTIYWRLSWGNYAGPTNVSNISNFVTTETAPIWPDPLSSAGTEGLLIQLASGDKGTNNAADYALTGGPALFINNANEGFTVDVSTDVEPPVDPGAPLEEFVVDLMQSRPNPAIGTAHVPFRLNGYADVVLDIYRVDGGRVRTIRAGRQGPGSHTIDWNGRDERGADVAPGVYFYRLTAGSESVSRRLQLVK